MIGRYGDSCASLLDPEALAIHLAVIRWSLDEFAPSGLLIRDVIQLLYREDQFARNELHVLGRVPDRTRWTKYPSRRLPIIQAGWSHPGDDRTEAALDVDPSRRSGRSVARSGSFPENGFRLLKDNYLAFVQLASIRPWLGANESRSSRASNTMVCRLHRDRSASGPRIQWDYFGFGDDTGLPLFCPTDQRFDNSAVEVTLPSH
ncbi:hypothetical protein [Bradyrhizobium sp. CCBAU 11357]|uniref:hypothetical protein n=1 Tax=Bradyrhizobium sp. CCBAU 11357 TaxID=1630808 RepID=UPI002304241B|nr:hypothetical protein [Bradyrhizobium sp. CCBAU 11357]